MVDNTGLGTGKLAPLYGNCIGYGGDYVEMQWNNSTITVQPNVSGWYWT